MRVVRSRSATRSTRLIRNASVTEPGWSYDWSVGCNICERNGRSRVSGRSPRQSFRDLASHTVASTHPPATWRDVGLIVRVLLSLDKKSLERPVQPEPALAGSTNPTHGFTRGSTTRSSGPITGSHKTPSDGRCGLFADRIGRGSQLLCSQAGKEGSEQILTHEKPKQTRLVQSRIDTRLQFRMSSRELAPM